jgi:hypothetical protein
VPRYLDREAYVVLRRSEKLFFEFKVQLWYHTEAVDPEGRIQASRIIVASGLSILAHLKPSTAIPDALAKVVEASHRAFSLSVAYNAILLLPAIARQLAQKSSASSGKNNEICDSQVTRSMSIP